MLRPYARPTTTPDAADGRIITTPEKAKCFRPMAEKLITLAKEKNLHNVRRAMAEVPDKTVIKKLFDEIGPHFKDRPGGYTRIVRLAKNRLGDDGGRAIWELVGLEKAVIEDDG